MHKHSEISPVASCLVHEEKFSPFDMFHKLKPQPKFERNPWLHPIVLLLPSPPCTPSYPDAATAPLLPAGLARRVDTSTSSTCTRLDTSKAYGWGGRDRQRRTGNTWGGYGRRHGGLWRPLRETGGGTEARRQRRWWRPRYEMNKILNWGVFLGVLVSD